MSGLRASPLALWTRFFFGTIDARVVSLFRIVFGLSLLESLVDLQAAVPNVLSGSGMLREEVVRATSGASGYYALFMIPEEGMAIPIAAGIALFAAGVARIVLSARGDVGRQADVSAALEAIVGASLFYLCFSTLVDPERVDVLSRLALLAVLCFTLGIATRSANAFALLWMIYVRNRIIISTGGWDCLHVVGLFWLIFTPADLRFSVAAWWRARRGAAPGEDQGDAHRLRVTAWPVQCLKIQLSVLYLVTAVLKASYPEWREGTAMIYVMISEFSRLPGWPWAVSPAFGVLAAAMTWGSLAIEFFVPIALWHARTYRFAIACGWFLHLCIHLTMDIPHFSLAVSSFYLLFLRPADFEWVTRLLARRREPDAAAGLTQST